MVLHLNSEGFEIRLLIGSWILDFGCEILDFRF